MKKTILYVLLILGLGAFVSCEEKTTWDQSEITYYISIEIEGDEILFWDLNTPFVDPGYSAELKGEDFTDDVVVTTDLDVNEAGIYTITYSATNEDGYANVLSRTVVVSDPTPSTLPTGYYVTDEDSFRKNTETGVKTIYNDSFELIVFQVEPGVFYVTDFLGGYYDQRAGYGSNYAMEGYFTLNPDNTITAVPEDTYVAGWGERMDSLSNGVYNPATKTFYWEVLYAGVLLFHVTATFAN